MGEVIILDQVKAAALLSLGFKYIKRKIDNKDVFVLCRPKSL